MNLGNVFTLVTLKHFINIKIFYVIEEALNREFPNHCYSFVGIKLFINFGKIN